MIFFPKIKLKIFIITTSIVILFIIGTLAVSFLLLQNEQLAKELKEYQKKEETVNDLRICVDSAEKTSVDQFWKACKALTDTGTCIGYTDMVLEFNARYIEKQPEDLRRPEDAIILDMYRIRKELPENKDKCLTNFLNAIE